MNLYRWPDKATKRKRLEVFMDSRTASVVLTDADLEMVVGGSWYGDCAKDAIGGAAGGAAGGALTGSMAGGVGALPGAGIGAAGGAVGGCVTGIVSSFF